MPRDRADFRLVRELDAGFGGRTGKAALVLFEWILMACAWLNSGCSFGSAGLAAARAARQLRRAAPGTLQLLAVAVLAVSCLNPTISFAQNSEQPSTPAAPAAESEAAAPDNQAALMLRTESGELIPVDQLGFDRTAIDELLQRVQLQNQVPLFNISELNLQGRVERDVFRLNVSLSVTVLPEREWVRVPVEFGELQVAGLPESKDLPGGRSVFDSDASNRKEWWLYGQGVHELSVELIGQIRNTPTGSPRIRFTAPRAARSHLVLVFDELVDDVTCSGAVPPRVTQDTAAPRTTVELWGLAGETDVTWQPQLVDATPQLLVQALTPAQMTLDLRTVPGSLSCRQTLEILGGSVDRINVRLPPGFRAVAITADGPEGTSVVRSFAPADPADNATDSAGDQPGRVMTVRFSEAVRGIVSMKYDLELSATTFPQSVSLTLPDIERVRNESGNIDILIPLGLLVEPDATTMIQARRKRVETLTDTKTAATAYQLLSAESRIDLRVSEIEAFFAVDPQVEIATEQNNNNVLLTVRFPVNVIHGSLNEITVLWKNLAQDGWQIWPGSTVLITDDGTTPLPVKMSDTNPDEIQLVFPDRQSGQFLIELRAFRNLASFLPQTADNRDRQNSESSTEADVRGDDEFFLPDVPASTDHATTVTLVESDAWSIRLTDQDGGSEFPSVPISRQAGDGNGQAEQITARLVEESGSAVRIRLTSQQPEVRASAVVDLRQASGSGSLHVHEELQFSVRHRDLDEIRLVIPDGVIPTVRLHQQTETLQPLATSSRESVFQLPVPKRGEFVVDVDYHWTPPATAVAPPQTVDVPLVLPSLTIQQVTVGTDLLNAFQLQTSADWVPVYSDRFAAAWRSGKAVAEVPVTLLSTLARIRPADSELTIFRTVISGQHCTTLASALFKSAPETVLFSVPPGAEVLAAAVNGEPTEPVVLTQADYSPESDDDEVTGQLIAESETAATLWRVSVPDRERQAETSTVTVVEFRIRQRLTHHNGLVSQSRPQLPVVSDSDATQIWLVNSDTDETLLARCQTYGWSQRSAVTEIPWLTDTDPVQFLTPLLAVYETPVQQAALKLLEEDNPAVGSTVVLVGGGRQRSGELLRFTTKAVLLLLSVLAVATYLVFQRMQQVPLISLAVYGVSLATVVFALVPAEYTPVVVLSAAGTVVGALAALVQRLMVNRPAATMVTARSPDQSTIFAVERGRYNSESSASGPRPELVGSASEAGRSEPVS